MASQQFCLKWNNHTNNMLNVFDNLLSTEALVDVTLACDGLSLKAHKMVLSACSPFFQSLFLENPCKHPIVIMKDMNYKDLKAIVDFMYRGEVNVSQDQLSALLKTAETLKVKGLAEVSGENRQASGVVQQEISAPQQNSVPIPTSSSTPQQPPQPQQRRADSPPIHGKRKRGRPRKRSLSDSNRSDDEMVPTKIKEPDSPEIEELSGDASMEAVGNDNVIRQGSNSSQGPIHSSVNSYSSKHPHSASNAQVEEPPSGEENEFEVEPSKLLEQTLTTDNVPPMSNAASSSTISSANFNLPSSSGIEISQISMSGDNQALVPVSGTSDSLSSSHLQGPDSPQDIKPAILTFEEPPISPVAGTSQSMVYMDQSSLPGPSNYQDNSLVQHDAQPQEEDIDVETIGDVTEANLKELSFRLGTRRKLLKIIETLNPRSAYEMGYTDLSNSLASIPGCSGEFKRSAFGPSRVSFSSARTIKVREIIQLNPKGKSILSMLDSGKIISKKEINEIIRICVNAMVDELKSLYPTAEQKVNLAKAIIRDIPKLRIMREDVDGYEHLFDPKSRTGQIEWRLKTMRLSLNPSEKKNRKRRMSINNANTEESEIKVHEDTLQEKIVWLQHQVPSEAYRAEIFKAMKETFEVRRQFIKDATPTITTILAKYPKFKDFNGSLIDAEFTELHPKASSLLSVFPHVYVKRIKKYIEQKRPDIKERVGEVNDDNLCSMLMLAELLPVTGLRKKGTGTGVFPSDVIVRFTGVNISLADIGKEKEITGKQPFLLCPGERTDLEKRFFLVLDDETVDVGTDFLKACDIFFKTHYAFSVPCNGQLTLFFNFLEHFIYSMVKGAARSMVENINNILLSLDL